MDPDAVAAPRTPAGTIQLGSDLEPGPVTRTGCSEVPGPNTPACTLVQTAIAGRPATVERAGVIRSWSVRGARGEIALQVIGRRGGDEYLRGFSQAELVTGPAPKSFAANIAVRRGDRLGVLLAPGAVIGSRSPPPESHGIRLEGSLDYSPHPQGSTRVDQELLFRADVEPGALPDLEQVTGSEAKVAASGKTLAKQVIRPRSGGVVRVEAVQLGDRIALDGFRGGRRIARALVADAGIGGDLLELNAQCGYPHGFCFRWLNEGELAPVIHVYELVRDGTAFRLFG